MPVDLVPTVLLAFGLGAAVGNAAGGQLADRLGARPTVVGALLLSAVLLAGLSLVVQLPSGLLAPIFFAVIFLWGAAGWAGG